MLTPMLLMLAAAQADTPAELPEPAPVVVEVPPEVAEVAPQAPTLWLQDQHVEVSGLANDVFAMGQLVQLVGSVQDNAFAMGQTVQLADQGQVDGDLLALGQIVRIDRPVEGDVYAVAEQLRIGPEGVVGGDLYGGGALVVIEGSVLGDVEVGAGRVDLQGTVGGDFTVEAGELDIAPGAVVGGDLAYTASQEAELPAGAVGGGVSFDEIELSTHGGAKSEPSLLAEAAWGALGLGWKYLSSLIVGFVLLALGGEERVRRAARLVRSQPARSAGIGFVIAVVLPVAALVAMALILPLPLGVLGLVVWGVGLYVARLLVAQALGDAILGQVRPDSTGSPYLSLAVGLPAILLAFQIPWLGALLWLGVTVLGLGALWSGVVRAE